MHQPPALFALVDPSLFLPHSTFNPSNATYLFQTSLDEISFDSVKVPPVFYCHCVMVRTHVLRPLVRIEVRSSLKVLTCGTTGMKMVPFACLLFSQPAKFAKLNGRYSCSLSKFNGWENLGVYSISTINPLIPVPGIYLIYSPLSS
jgi:hypothetical protein